MNRLLTRVLALVLAAAATVQAQDFGSLLAPLHIAPAPAGSGYGAARTAGPAVPVRYVDEQDVIGALATALSERWPSDGQLRLNFAHAFTRVRLAGDDEWQLNLIETPPGGMASSMIVRFSLMQGEKRLGEWTCLLRAQLWRPVCIAERRIERGTLLEKDLATMQVMDSLRESQGLIPWDTDLSAYEMAQTVNAGRPISWHDVSPRPTVRKGQVVDVTAGDGALSIKVKALALANGAIGDVISVRNLESRRDFPAKVTGINSAQVAF
jgi:flagella basal body P-ring formation protein FlgA